MDSMSVGENGYFFLSPLSLMVVLNPSSEMDGGKYFPEVPLRESTVRSFFFFLYFCFLSSW